MIESRYWKEDLLAHAKRLEPVKEPRRWTDRAVVNFEKELMISFFMVRVLLERNKTSSKSRNYRVPVRRAPWNGRPITQLNYWDVEENYHFPDENDTLVPLMFLTNQFIHSKVLYAGRDKTRNWVEVLVCSDYEVKKSIFRVPMEEIREIFRMVGEDYPSSISYTFNPKTGDYDVTCD